MLRKHCSRAGRRAGAAMNFNRPIYQTTNQMTFIGVKPITGERFFSLKKSHSICCQKVHFVRTFTLSKKDKLVRCSHFLQHLWTNNSPLFVLVFALICLHFMHKLKPYSYFFFTSILLLWHLFRWPGPRVLCSRTKMTEYALWIPALNDAVL